MKIDLDVELLRRILLDMRVAADDADAVVKDMFRRRRRRQLGRVTHRASYRDARDKLVTQIAYLLRLLGAEPPPAPPESTPPTH